MAEFEMRPTERLTVGTLGEPGNRTFYLQGISGLDSYAVIIEKQQAVALADAIGELLEELENRYEIPPPRAERVPRHQMELQMPVEGRFRVGQIGLGYEEESRLVMVAVQGLASAEEEAPVARFWVTLDQIAALGKQAREIASQGRPTCALCGQPIDPEGHFCPRSNGHGH